MSFIWYIVIGMAAGLVASKITKGEGFGLSVNLVLGIIGGVLGGWLFSLLGIYVNDISIVGNLLMSTVGAIALLCIANIFGQA